MNTVFIGVWGLSQQVLPTLADVYCIVKIWHVYCQ